MRTDDATEPKTGAHNEKARKKRLSATKSRDYQGKEEGEEGGA